MSKKTSAECGFKEEGEVLLVYSWLLKVERSYFQSKRNTRRTALIIQFKENVVQPEYNQDVSFSKVFFYNESSIKKSRIESSFFVCVAYSDSVPTRKNVKLQMKRHKEASPNAESETKKLKMEKKKVFFFSCCNSLSFRFLLSVMLSDVCYLYPRYLRRMSKRTKNRT